MRIAPRPPRWSPAAEIDLKAIWRYYAETASVEVADRIYRKLVEGALSAAEQPLAGRSRDDLVPGLRAAIVHPWLVFYRAASDRVEIVRLLHGRRDLASQFRVDDPEDG